MPVTRSQHNRSQGLSLDRDTTNDSGTVDLGVGVDTSVAPSIPQAQGSRRSSRIQSGDTRIFEDKSTKEKGKEKEKEKGKGRGQSQRNQSSGKIGSRRMGQQESSESGVMREDGSKVDSREKEKNNSEDFVFFWKTNEKYGWASQWYYSPFSARIRFEVQTRKSKANSPGNSRSKNPPQIIDSGKAYTFPTAEHYMMASKSLLFSDLTIFHQILSNPGKSQSDLREVKALGRKVKNFDEEVWVANRRDIVLRGNLEKFGGRGTELRRKLVGFGGDKTRNGDGEEEEGTGEKEIVEASPLDRVWGIGFGEKRALEVGKERWGLNLLGLVLMDVRRILREEEEKENATAHRSQDDNVKEGESGGIGMDVVMEDET